jgi:CRP-like cAMP-binding protein
MVTELGDQSSTLLPFLAKLEGHAALNASDREAILSLPHTIRTVEAGRYLFREGERASNCCVILSGFACRHKIVSDGGRQILSVHMKGDGIDLQNALLALTDHNIQALTRLEAALIPAEAISALISTHDGAARAMWVETLVDAAIQREWTVNVGRRDARTRIAHLICEVGLRMEAAGVAVRDRFESPLTQEQFADATGLTAVHVNRVLKALTSEGVIAREKRILAVDSWERLTEAGDFRSSYLHPLEVSLPA